MADTLFGDLPVQDLTGFVPVAKLSELQRGKMKRVDVGDQSILLTVLASEDNLAGIEVAAFTSVCPHALGDLSYGSIYKGEVDCPDHGYRYDARTGACIFPRLGPRLDVYPVHVQQDGTVLVKVERPAWMASSE